MGDKNDRASGVSAAAGASAAGTARAEDAAGGAASAPLSYVEFNILLALAKEDMHGYAIMGDTAERTNGAVTLEPGNLYRALQRMEGKGWVEEAGRKTDDDLGQRRRYYRITVAGRAAAAAETARMDDLVRTARSRAINPELA